MEPLRISFLLRSVYGVLPSPSNLLKWGLLETPGCQLCGARDTMAHILSDCKLALQQGRYRWRHDRVIRSLANIWEREEIKSNHKRHAYRNQVCKSRWNSAHVLWEKQHIRWLSMADEGGPHTQTRPPRCDPNYAASRHSSVVCRRQNDHHHRANSAMGGRLRRGLRTKELKVLRTGGGMPGSWLENLVIPSWSGMPRISCPFRLSNAKSYRDDPICGTTRKRAVRTLGETAEKASCLI